MYLLRGMNMRILELTPELVSRAFQHLVSRKSEQGQLPKELENLTQAEWVQLIELLRHLQLEKAQSSLH
jgi:hypothetical protein